MAGKSKQWRTLTIRDLTKHANSNSNVDAQQALDRYYKLKEAGGKPEIRYSEFHGYRVDEK